MVKSTCEALSVVHREPHFFYMKLFTEENFLIIALLGLYGGGIIYLWQRFGFQGMLLILVGISIIEIVSITGLWMKMNGLI